MKKADIPQAYCEIIGCAAARLNRVGCLYSEPIEPECFHPDVKEAEVKRWIAEQGAEEWQKWGKIRKK